MNRRSFLEILAGTGSAVATSYFFAPIGGWHSDVIFTPWEFNPWEPLLAYEVGKELEPMLIERRMVDPSNPSRWVYRVMDRHGKQQIAWRNGTDLILRRLA